MENRWNDLWLKEGFVVYLEYVAVDHVYSNYDIVSEFELKLMILEIMSQILNKLILKKYEKKNQFPV
jgi:hypothetical protein